MLPASMHAWTSFKTVLSMQQISVSYLKFILYILGFVKVSWKSLPDIIIQREIFYERVFVMEWNYSYVLYLTR